MHSREATVRGGAGIIDELTRKINIRKGRIQFQ